ncbi:(2Fe-2S)-binding protein [Frankia canadensis]|uniref:(2Fe-2S)-binding protein n=1 Tax=Frankia canadensis TaxID=1836972 RepID=A0A2I2L2R8_9ACTN|nr:aromatic ring-hydroxylating dioxygenase subunit alpha [Frankia canadensis]SNQ52226.1 (2Fe-2S)-binding protein [Frankia canadensis]SOU59516.1 (2Fe-2S)-binding protein [Frankia canadensis]
MTISSPEDVALGTAADSARTPSAPPTVVAKDVYIDPAYVALEKERLWPRVWQVACREEEIEAPGSYVTFEVADESIIVTRQRDGSIRAFYNACQHRGRRLTEGCGVAGHFYCQYHGWRWNLDGSLREAVDRGDWGDSVTDQELRLKEPLVDTWAGFVFINMDPNAEPLLDYLHPLPEIFDPFEFHTFRYRWYKSVVLPANWKTCLEAFNEGYHVQTTHPQLLRYNDDQTYSVAHGRHGMFGGADDNRPLGAPSRRLDLPVPEGFDYRDGVVRFVEMMEETLGAIWTPRDLAAAKRMAAELPDGTDPYRVLGTMMLFAAESAMADGAGWPNLTPENFVRAGQDWHIFPNLIVLPYPDGALWYRSRPNGDDPDSCIYDIWSLARYPKGEEPPLRREFYQDWHDSDEWGLILTQDFRNMAAVQQGMKSRGFAGPRPSPRQEQAIANFHRVLQEYLAMRPVTA